MASNKLMEAAADILSGSKSRASAMPPQKLDGGVVDIGGPTPQNYKSNDDSAKLDTTKAAKLATAPTTKPSAASGKIQTLSQEEFDELSEEEQEMYLEQLDQLDEVLDTPVRTLKYGIKAVKSGLGAVIRGDKRTADKRIRGLAKAQQNLDKKHNLSQEEYEEDYSFADDVDAIFADDSTISEEFKTKATTIFEARVYDRVAQIQEQLETEYASMLEEAVESIKEDLTTKVDDYLNYVVEQWLEENEIAIETGLRAELTEEFIAGLRNLFAEHYIDVPVEKVDLVDELAGKVEELESKLDEEIQRNVDYKKALIESVKVEITRDVCAGLTETQFEKIKTLAESVEFSTEEEFKEKIETIRENYYPSGVKKANVTQLHEQVEDGSEKQTTSADPYVASVVNAISKTRI